MRNKLKVIILITTLLMSLLVFSGCGNGGEDYVCPLEDGVYEVTFTTDSTMFHINESLDDKATLTVEDGEMTLHITLQSKNIVNLYPGLAEDAMNDEDGILQPTVDQVTYSDGMTDEVYGFDVPVRVIDEEFDLALIGTHGNWYDHKVKISNPVLITGKNLDIADGEYTIEVSMEGGSGRADIQSPCELKVVDGAVTAVIIWSSENYDYMLVDGNRYEPVTTEGGSTFEIPVSVFDEPMDVVGDTTAMSEPHEIDYKFIFDSTTLKEK